MRPGEDAQWSTIIIESRISAKRSTWARPVGRLKAIMIDQTEVCNLR